MRPDRTTLFDNKLLPSWLKWIEHHDYMSLGIPSNTSNMADVRVACSNPFDGTAIIIKDGRYITVDVARPVYRCDECLRLCPLPPIIIPNKYFFLGPGDNVCPVCVTVFRVPKS